MLLHAIHRVENPFRAEERERGGSLVIVRLSLGHSMPRSFDSTDAFYSQMRNDATGALNFSGTLRNAAHHCKLMRCQHWDPASGAVVQNNGRGDDSLSEADIRLAPMARRELVQVIAFRPGQTRKLELLIDCAGTQQCEERCRSRANHCGCVHICSIADAK